jgi:hypothetical protein
VTMMTTFLLVVRESGQIVRCMWYLTCCRRKKELESRLPLCGHGDRK